MKERNISNEEALSGFSHAYDVTLADLKALGAVASGTIVLGPYTPGTAIQNAGFKLAEAVDGSTTSACSLELGYTGTSTTDIDGLLDGYEIHKDSTEITFGLANGADFATLKTGYVALDSGNLGAVFALTNGTFDQLTAGAVTIFLKRVDLTKL